MTTIKHIVAPFDYSDRATAMVRYAGRLAQQFRAKLTILHVLEIPATTPKSPFPDAYRLLGVTEDLVAKHVQALESYQFPFPLLADTERVVVRGEAAESIVEWCRANNVDLIVMPTRGRDVLRRFLLGSVCAKVLDIAEQPVLTSAHTEHIPDLGVTNILCAIDLEEHSSKTLRYAYDFAKSVGAEFHIAHAVEVQDMSEALTFGSEWEHRAVEEAKQRIHALEESVGSRGDIHVRVGAPLKVIPQLAESLGADLLVVGRSVKGKAGSFLRTNAYGLIRESPCAVLSV